MTKCTYIHHTNVKNIIVIATFKKYISIYNIYAKYDFLTSEFKFMKHLI